MGRRILILKNVEKYASSKMLMHISGKDHARIFKSVMFYKIDEVKGLNFLKMEGLHM